MDDVGLNIIGSYIQEVDRNIKASKERKDVKRIVTLLGEVEYDWYTSMIGLKREEGGMY